MRWRAARLLAAALALAACGDDDGGPAPSADAAPGADGGGGDAPTGPTDIRVSQRSIEGASIDTGVDAVWWASPLPDRYVVVSRSGPCVSTAVDLAGCDAFCDGICTGGACQPYPETRSAGRLTVGGVDIEPLDGRYAHYQGAPLFAAGDRVAVAAAGDQIAAFEVETAAVADLAAPGIDDLEMVPGEDLTVSWQPAAGESWIRLRLESNQHGQLSPTVIECAVADAAGSITVPGSMIEEFWPTPGQCGECPVQSLIRYRRASATAGDLPVVLEYASVVSFYPYR